MRILYLIIIEDGTGTDMKRSLFARVARPGVTVDVKHVKRGLKTGTESMLNQYFHLLTKRETVEEVINAEREGYDAAVIGCFDDPGVLEARSAVSIPVIGPGEATLHFACQLGSKFGIVTLGDQQIISQLETMIYNHGLSSRAIPHPVRPIALSNQDVYGRGSTNEAECVSSAILDRARELVADGAEVVIAGCCSLGPQCTLTGVNKVPEAEVPILDPATIAVKTAELMVDMKATTGLMSASRVGVFRLPSKADMEDYRKRFGLIPA